MSVVTAVHRVKKIEFTPIKECKADGGRIFWHREIIIKDNDGAGMEFTLYADTINGLIVVERS